MTALHATRVFVNMSCGGALTACFCPRASVPQALLSDSQQRSCSMKTIGKTRLRKIGPSILPLPHHPPAPTPSSPLPLRPCVQCLGLERCSTQVRRALQGTVQRRRDTASDVCSDRRAHAGRKDVRGLLGDLSKVLKRNAGTNKIRMPVGALPARHPRVIPQCHCAVPLAL